MTVQPVEWKDWPDESTPLEAELLNQMQGFVQQQADIAVAAAAEATAPAEEMVETIVSEVAVAKGELAVSVRDFGAVGDGSTDDSTAFAAAAASGRPVFVASGTYRVASAPAGRFYGPGVLVADTAPSIEIALDDAVPHPVDSTLTISTGPRNDTAIGAGARLSAGPGAGANVAVGEDALRATSDGQRNTAVGSGALRALGDRNRSGVTSPSNNASKNVAVGTDAAREGAWGDSCTYVGSNAGKWTGDPDPIASKHDFFSGAPGGGTMVGIDAADRWPGVRSVVGALGTPLSVAATEVHNQENVGIGRNALLHAVRATECTAVGYNALAHGYNVGQSTAVGQGALRDGIVADQCTAVGHASQLQNASGVGNTSLGAYALMSTTHNQFNTAVGHSAMRDLTSGLTEPGTDGRRNVAVGADAMASHTAGSFNIAIGSAALQGGTGGTNVAIGGASQSASTTGANNVSVGHNSLPDVTTGLRNVAIGVDAGTGVTSQTNSVAVGYQASAPFTSSVALGAGASATAANMVRIGSSSITLIQGQVGFTAVSDARDKADVADEDLGLDFIQRLRPVQYRLDPRDGEKDPTLRRGFIAQEVLDALGAVEAGAMVATQDPDQYGMSYTELIAPLTRAVQELAQRMDDIYRLLGGDDGGGSEV